MLGDTDSTGLGGFFYRLNARAQARRAFRRRLERLVRLAVVTTTPGTRHRSPARRRGDRSAPGVTIQSHPWNSCRGYPHHLRRVSAQKAKLVKVRILGYDREALRRRILPDGIVVRAAKPDVANVVTVREYICQGAHEPVRQVLVEEQVHVGGISRSRRSRSAANAKQARISSRVRSGKSLRISFSDMPEARYSRTSYTVIRSPRIQGFPPRFPGSIVIKAR